jgi:phospholipase C
MVMSGYREKKTRRRAAIGASVFALSAFGFATAGNAENPAEDVSTRTPIKHVIVIIGENASFDHVFATYEAKHDGFVWNLLSQGIVNENGQPGPAFSRAAQFTVSSQPQYYISAPAGSKTPYTTLPVPDLGGVPTAGSDTPSNGAPPPFATVEAAAAAEQSLEPQDVHLLTTGATGAAQTTGPDLRILNATHLANGPYQVTAKSHGQGLAYDSYTEDTFHRFFQMWQQYDCSVGHATKVNPSGCLADLLPFVITTFEGSIEGGQSTSMEFLNVQQGDAPFLKQLADTYTISDNYHQAVMGGTGSNHIMMMTGDQFYFNDGKGNPIAPPTIPAVFAGLPPTFPNISEVANPNPLPGTNNQYANDPGAALGDYVNCSDPTQPGVAAILSYLQSLPYHPKANCAPNTFYLINNLFPGFHVDGTPASLRNPHPGASDIFFVPPQTIPTIGDALNGKKVPWVYYGDGLGHALANDAFAAAYCPICDAMQYTSSTMADPAQRVAHLKDTSDFFHDIATHNVPSVSFVKPSGFVDGHPQSSKLDLYEAFVRSIVDKVQADRELFADTAIVVTWDEGGGYYDSGFIQPVDFFGDGPRLPLIVVSPFTKGGKVNHTYNDHASITKFIEANWKLQPLSSRSRDNLPNPVAEHHNPYVPTNMPAIGNLMDMFHFDGDDDHGDD